MDLKEKMQKVVEVMMTTKSEWVATEPEDTDLAIYLHFYRGDEMVVMVQCPLDRDVGLDAALVGASGFNADTMSFTFEGYHANTKNSPLTGKPWLHREMQYVAEAYPNRDWVHECLNTCMHERGGRYGMWSQPYKIVDHKVEWKDEEFIAADSADGLGGGGGVMYQVLQRAMAEPKIEEIIATKASTDQIAALMASLVLDPEARLFHMDMATLTAMEQRQVSTNVVLYAKAGSNRARWITERLGRPPDGPG